MQIWPAIDVRGGKCVRLRQGDYGQETVFHDDPIAAARLIASQGVEHLHVVDLDGARAGRPVNAEIVAEIVRQVSLEVEFGGGVRDDDSIDALLDLGLSRVVVGTSAVRDPAWFREAARRRPGKLVLGLDARDGLAATAGWEETSSVSATELAAEFAGEPLAAIVFTDIAADGMMAGPKLDSLRAMLAATEHPVIASGGVTTADDVRAIAAAGAAGCIIGRAFYEGALTLADALAAAGAESSTPP